MTHFLIFLTISAIVTLQLNAQTPSKPDFLLLPITKDESTNQFYTTFGIGAVENSPITLVIDLGTNLTWLDCRKIKSLSSVICESSTCKSIPDTTCMGRSCIYKQPNPFGLNPQVIGRISKDDIFIPTTDGAQFISPPALIDDFKFASAGKRNLQGLASPATGVLGLAPSNSSFMKQVTSTLEIKTKFSLCLPSSGLGHFYIGGGPFLIPPFDASGLIPLTVTPLMVTGGGDYRIILFSMSVGETRLPLRGDLISYGALLSTAVPYTLLHSDIYDLLADSFTQKAKAMGISKVSAVAPFKDCFDAGTIGMGVTGPVVPTIQLEVPIMLALKQWTFYGANTMVKVEETVMCLAFMDAGKEPKDKIVLGSYQLQDYMLDFDYSPTVSEPLTKWFLGFSESLLLHNTNCSSWPSRDENQLLKSYL